jgi:Lrp/AsnC family leucine-responsive transcriptional regulator
MARLIFVAIRHSPKRPKNGGLISFENAGFILSNPYLTEYFIDKLSNIGQISGMDDYDKELLRILQADNLKTSAELGAAVGLSVSAVNERVRKLNASGVITANRATVAPAALGMTLCAFIFVDLEARADEEAFRKAIIGFGEVQELHLITGPHGYLVKARAADAAALHALLAAIKRLPSVEQTETIVALGTHKETTLIEASPATLKPPPAKRQRQTATGRADKPRQRGRR